MSRSRPAHAEIHFPDRGSVAFRLQRSGLESADVNGSRNVAKLHKTFHMVAEA